MHSLEPSTEDTEQCRVTKTEWTGRVGDTYGEVK